MGVTSEESLPYLQSQLVALVLQLLLDLADGAGEEEAAERQLAGVGVSPLIHAHILRLKAGLQVQVAARDGVLDGLDVVDAGRALVAHVEHEEAELLHHGHFRRVLGRLPGLLSTRTMGSHISDRSWAGFLASCQHARWLARLPAFFCFFLIYSLHSFFLFSAFLHFFFFVQFKKK